MSLEFHQVMNEGDTFDRLVDIKQIAKAEIKNNFRHRCLLPFLRFFGMKKRDIHLDADRDNILNSIVNNKSCSWERCLTLVTYNNNDIGFRTGTSYDDSKFRSDFVYVLPKMRGRGFGKKIKEHQISFAWEAGSVEHVTVSLVRNEIANNLLTSFGFKLINTDHSFNHRSLIKRDGLS